jgi:hypothetical protein
MKPSCCNLFFEGGISLESYLFSFLLLPQCRVMLLFLSNLIQELFMTTFARSSSYWLSRTKVGLTLTLLVSQMTVQAAPSEPDPPDISNASNSGPVIVSTDKGKSPSKQRHLKRGPSKPEQYPTKPQQQVPHLR